MRELDKWHGRDHRLIMTRVLLSFLWIYTMGCGTRSIGVEDAGGDASSPSDAGVPLDGHQPWDAAYRPQPGALRSPDGEGVCCPHDAPSCDGPREGGFALDVSRCPGERTYDVPEYQYSVRRDEHGCFYLEHINVGDPNGCWPEPAELDARVRGRNPLLEFGSSVPRPG